MPTTTKPIPAWVAAAVSSVLVIGASGLSYFVGGMRSGGSIVFDPVAPPANADGKAQIYSDLAKHLAISNGVTSPGNIVCALNGVLPPLDGSNLTGIGGGTVDVARTWTTQQNFAPAAFDDGVAHTDLFASASQPVTIYSPVFNFDYKTQLSNPGGTDPARWTIAINNNVMTVVTDPTGTTPHGWTVGQWVQFRDASTLSNGFGDYASYSAGWTDNAFVATFGDYVTNTIFGNGSDLESDGIVAMEWPNNHGLHVGDYLSVAAADVFRDNMGLSVVKILSAPTSTTATFRFHTEQWVEQPDPHPVGLAILGIGALTYRVVQIKSVPTPCSFTCDFVHANQVATPETNTGARLQNIGFRWDVPDFARIAVREVTLQITDIGDAMGCISQAPEIYVGGLTYGGLGGNVDPFGGQTPGPAGYVLKGWKPLYQYTGVYGSPGIGDAFSISSGMTYWSGLMYASPPLGQTSLGDINMQSPSLATLSAMYNPAVPAVPTPGYPYTYGWKLRFKISFDYFKWWKR